MNPVTDINFTEGFKVGRSIGTSYANTPILPPETEFLTVNGHNFQFIIHKTAPGRKDYLIDPEWRTIAEIKIQGEVAGPIFKELEEQSVEGKKKFQKDEEGNKKLHSFNVRYLRVKDVDKVLNVITKLCNLDDDSSNRVFAFMSKTLVIRETKERILEATKRRNELIKAVWTKENITKGTLKIIHDLAHIEPSEKRNYIISNALNGFYDNYSGILTLPKTTLAAHLQEADCSDLANEVYKGRYD